MKKIFRHIKKFRLIGLILLGVLLAEVTLRFMGFYRPSLVQSLNSILEIKKKLDHSGVRIPDPIDFSLLENYEYRNSVLADPVYGLATFKKNSRDIFKSHYKLIWDVQYNVDGLGRRINPASSEIKSAKDFVVFYGGSRTYGQGVQDAETLPNQFQKLVQHTRVYNYGIPGAGPNVFLRKHENGDFVSEIPQSQGVFVYIFDFGHENRMLGTRDSTWVYATPYYDLDKNGEVEYRGNFWENRTIKSAFYHLASMSAIYYNLVLKPDYGVLTVNEQDIEFIKKFFLKMRAEVAKQNGSKFLLVFFEPEPDKPYLKPVWEALRKSDLDILVNEVGELPSYSSGTYFEYDQHPKPIIYKAQAELIKRELKKRNWLAD